MDKLSSSAATGAQAMPSKAASTRTPGTTKMIVSSYCIGHSWHTGLPSKAAPTCTPGTAVNIIYSDCLGHSWHPGLPSKEAHTGKSGTTSSIIHHDCLGHSLDLAQARPRRMTPGTRGPSTWLQTMLWTFCQSCGYCTHEPLMTSLSPTWIS